MNTASYSLAQDQTRILVICLGLLVGILAAYAVSGLVVDLSPPSVGKQSLSVADKILPIAFCGTLVWTAFQLIRANRLMIWTPLPWFLAACAAYFGFGPLVYHFGRSGTVAVLSTFYPVEESDLWHTNILNAISVFVVMASYMLGARLVRIDRHPIVQEVDTGLLQRTAIIFLSLGLAVKYLLALPYYFGMLDLTVPGGILQLQSFSLLAIIVVMVLVSKGGTKWRLVLYPLVAAELATAILEFSKMSVLITLMTLTLGWYLTRPRAWVLFAGAALLVTTYVATTPLVPFGRGEIVNRTGTIYQAGLAERAEILTGYLESGDASGGVEFSGHQSWWARLSYVNAQTFAMRSYDGGSPGRSFTLAGYAFVPRALWPDKPSITGVAEDFTFLVTGIRASSSAPGAFAEAYWNGGWLMVVLSCVYLGVLFTGFSYYAVRRMALMDVSLLPVVFIGIRMGFRPDGWFAAEYVGALAIAVVLHLALSMTIGYSARRETSPATRAGD